jgi:hypothetical protein
VERRAQKNNSICYTKHAAAITTFVGDIIIIIINNN